MGSTNDVGVPPTSFELLMAIRTVSLAEGDDAMATRNSSPDAPVTNGARNSSSSGPGWAENIAGVPSVLVRYGGAAALTLIAAAIGGLLLGTFGQAAAIAPFYAVVLLVAVMAGTLPAFLTIMLSGAVLGLWFMPTNLTDGLVAIGLLAAYGLMVVALTESRRPRTDSPMMPVAAITTRERHGETLRTREVPLGPLGSWEWNAATDPNTVTDELCRILGLPAGQPIPDFKDQDGRLDPHEAWVPWNTAVKTGQGNDRELQALQSDGPIGIHTRCEVVRDGDGRVRGLRGTVLDITQRTHADERLRSNESRLRGLFDQPFMGIAELDREGRFLRVNDRYCTITGYRRDELLGGLRWVDITAPEDQPENREQWQRLITEGTSFEVEKRDVRKDGSRVWVHSSMSAIGDREGGIGSLVAFSVDITERRRAEVAIRVSEERLRLAVRASNIGLWDWDFKTDQVVYSSEYKRQLGYADHEIGNHFGEWERRVHPDDLEPTLHRIREAIASGETTYEVEFRLRHKEGSWRSIFARADIIRDTEGAPVRLLGCHLDVTERKQAEDAIREREARLAAILNTAADAIITINRSGMIQTINRAAERMFGYAPGELIGRRVSTLMPSPHRDRHDGYLARYISTGQTKILGIDRELSGLRKDGSIFPIELAVSEIEHFEQFTGIVRDVTRRKDLEREVVEAATGEQRRIGQDLHDTVGQELTALHMHAGDLADALRTDLPIAPDLVERIGRGLRRCQAELRSVIRGLLPVAVDAEGLMASLADLADRTSREGTVRCAFDCPEPVTVANNLTATQLYLIAQEAVHNAVKHAHARMVNVALAPIEDHGLLLRVADDGRGLSPEPTMGQGQGMRIMGHRANIIGARLTVSPAEPSGTVVTCELVGGNHG